MFFCANHLVALRVFGKIARCCRPEAAATGRRVGAAGRSRRHLFAAVVGRTISVVQVFHLFLYPPDLPESLQPVAGVRHVVLLAQARQYLRGQLQQNKIQINVQKKRDLLQKIKHIS